MQKLAKRFSVFMAAIMTMSMMLNFVITAPAKAAAVYPQVQYAQEPQLEYTVGDRVQFNLYTPNYGGRVQYRVVLWHDETKSYKDLWTNTPDRYYDKWMPYGNNIFTLGWVINEPGHYRITIYAKRAGIPNNETFLKGFNCDSYMESDSFVVKAKEVVAQPDVASEKIELASVTTSPAAINGHISKAAQAIVGKDYELAVKVDKPGVKVMFQLDAPDGSLNKDEVLEAVSGSDNVAKVSYKRLYADADYVTAYVAAAPTVRTAMKVYWGVDKILDIAATDENAASAANGNVKSYKVTLKNPITGERMRDRELLVLVRENIDAPNNASLSTALITNPYGEKATTYQRMNNIVTGGLNEETIRLITNDNGEATFTVTGINTKATPVVFYDDWTFYRGPDDNGYDTPDNSQFKPTYCGNNNGRWDATELQVEPATVTFNASTYTFEQTPISDPYTAVDSAFKTGRTYTVTVKDSEGKPYKYGVVNIAINEVIDNIYGTNTNARIISFGNDASHLNACTPTYQIQATTSSTGTIAFKIASNKVNDMATPVIWIDQDNASPVNGARNGILEPADPQKLLSQTTFVEAAVKSGSFFAELNNGDLVMDVDENDDVISINGEPVNFKYNVRNQNGSNWMPAGSYANITYTIQNVGNSPVTVFAPVAGGAVATGLTVDGEIGWPSVGYVIIPTYQTKTISFRTYSATGNYVQIVADKSAMVNVTANANLVSETNTAGAWLAPATAVASWVKTTDVDSYTARTLFSSTVFGYNLVDNYVIAVPVTDTGSYVKIPYDAYDEYTVSTTQHQPTLDSDIVEFERQITIDDGLTFRYGNGNANYISLYNADNSYDDEASDDDVPPTPVLSITDAVTREGANEVTTYAQETLINVISGTDTNTVGYFRFGDKVFTPSAGMSIQQIAQMIANAGQITIDEVVFDVELANVEGVPSGILFTTDLENATEIDVLGAFDNPNNTGIILEHIARGEGEEASDVIVTTTPAVVEQLTITVNTASPTTKTVKITLTDKQGDEVVVICESIVDILAGDSAAIVAQKIFQEMEWDLGTTNYGIELVGNKIIITNTVSGPANLDATIQ